MTTTAPGSSPDPFSVLVIGAGGREHALARAIAADPAVTAVHVAPGNPGTASFATNHAVNPLDGAAVAELAVGLGAGLVVVGPEAPLVAGVADAVRAAGVACFGPSAEAAQIEGSKAFAKDIMMAAAVPTAAARVCDTADQVARALDEFGPPYVVKDDGLAAGKGVIVTDNRPRAEAHAADCSRVVIEEYLDGPEVSLFVITDGITCVALQPAQDFKRAGIGDTGPNTGGMGAYSPLPWAPADLAQAVLKQVAVPTLDELKLRGIPFTGLLYCGLALTSKGLRVVEFNARFGDPETQALLALIDVPVGQLLLAAAQARLAEFGPVTWREASSVVVVAAAPGYPEQPQTGGQIILPGDRDDAWVIQAGTAERDGQLVSAGGRVLTIVGRGTTLAAARSQAYSLIADLDFPGGVHRSDIAEVAAAEQSRTAGYSDDHEGPRA